MVAHIPLLEVLGCQARIHVALQVDPLDPTLVDEVVDIHRAPGSRHGLVDGGNAQRVGAGLLPVNVDAELRLVILTVGAYRHQQRMLVGQLQELVTCGHEPLMAKTDVVLQEEVEAHGVTHFQNGWRREHHDLSVLDLVEALLRPLGQAEYILTVLAAQGPVLQLHKGRTGVLATTGKVEAADGLRRGDDVGLFLQQIVAHFGQYRFGTLGAGVGRHAHFHHQQALVFIRQEGRRYLLEQKAGTHHDQQEHHQIAPTTRQHAADAALETLGAAVEAAVEPAKEAFLLVQGLAGLGRLEDGRAQRRGEDQCDQYRQRHADHDGDGELAVDDTGRAAEEGHGHEHGGQHHADTDQRALDLVHGFAGRFQRRQPFVMHQALYVFHHDDGVVHQQPDGQYHGVHGQHVDVQAEQRQQGEGTEQDHRHRQGGNQSGAEALHEQIHDQEHQHNRFDNGHHYRADRCLHHGCGVIGVDDFHAFREERPLGVQYRAYAFNRLQQVATRGQTQGNRCGGHTVETAGNGIVVRAQADFRDVLHAHLRAVLVDLDQNLTEFFCGGQAGTADNGGVELVAAVCGQAAQLPGGHLHVLLADGVGHVAGGQLKAVEFGRVQPDAHGILRA